MHPDIPGLRLQIAAHTSKSSCYIRLENMVFDVTPFLKEHPGGEALLLQMSGSQDRAAVPPLLLLHVAAIVFMLCSIPSSSAVTARLLCHFSLPASCAWSHLASTHMPLRTTRLTEDLCVCRYSH